jgi:hypothetical protein
MSPASNLKTGLPLFVGVGPKRELLWTIYFIGWTKEMIRV